MAVLTLTPKLLASSTIAAWVSKEAIITFGGASHEGESSRALPLIAR